MRWTLAAVGLFSLALASCTGKDSQPEQAQGGTESADPELPPVGARVLLRSDRGVATTPERNATRVSGDDPKLRIAEVIAHVGEFVQLRNVLDEPRDICTAGGSDSAFRLYFYVLPDELEPVLAKPKQVEFADGTKLELAPGIPIVGAGPSRRLRVGSAEFAVPLDDDEIATWFHAEPVERANAHVRWPLGRPLYYGDNAITATTDPPFIAAHKYQAIDSGTLLTFVNACGRFTLRTDVAADATAVTYATGSRAEVPQIADNFDPDMFAQSQRILSVVRQPADSDDVWAELGSCDPVRWLASSKTELVWQETGTPAGAVAQDTLLPRDASERGDKVCFPVTGLDVCIDSAQLQRQEQDCSHERPSFGSRGQRVPQVRQARAQVSKGLDGDLVRRIVRAHINEVRSCYRAGLNEDPKLAGRVEIAFEIGANGKVTSSAVKQDKLGDENVANCIAKAVKRWTFPKPEGGAKVSVVYPFVLAPG